MKYWPVGLFVEVAESLIGRALLFFTALFLGSSIGLSVAAEKILITYQIFAYMALAVWALSSIVCVLISIGLVFCLVVYLIFEMKHWFLIPIAALAALHAYFGYRFFEN